MKSLRFVAGILFTLILACCNGGSVTERIPPLKSLESVPAAELQKLLNARLFFGHQSVGFNIVEGIGDVLSDKGDRSFAITQTSDLAISSEPGFFHSTIGQNEDPLGKIRDFDAILRGGSAEHLDIAFMKLCYVDIQADTDVTAVFRGYKDTMARLKIDFPKTVFVHFTVPIVRREKGIKPLLKRLLGRQVEGFGSDDNLAREKLNELLRNEYAGKEPLFDLALYESTRADGSRTAFTLNGGRYYALEDAYTDDGGHLNQTGRRFIAEQLLVFLAGVVR
jgi:hypothetical protein